MDVSKVIIIGSGPAGLTAAIYLARADLSPLVLAGTTPGGQLMYTTVVENFPGFPDGIGGADLMMKMMEHAKKFGATIELVNATHVDFTSKPFIVQTETQSYETHAVILAMGASPKTLGVPGEKEFFGKGVSTCATCDAPLFRDKDVVVIGGGDAAMEDALVMAKFARDVKILVRNENLVQMKASEIMKKRAQENGKITFVFNSEVREILGEGMVTGVQVFNKQTNLEATIPCQGVFLAIGHKPNTDFLKGQLELNDLGYIQSSDGIHTSKEGVFVGGDVQDYKYRQAITAAGLGCMAALEAERFLEHNRV